MNVCVCVCVAFVVQLSGVQEVWIVMRSYLHWMGVRLFRMVLINSWKTSLGRSTFFSQSLVVFGGLFPSVPSFCFQQLPLFWFVLSILISLHSVTACFWRWQYCSHIWRGNSHSADCLLDFFKKVISFIHNHFPWKKHLQKKIGSHNVSLWQSHKAGSEKQARYGCM